MSDGEWCGWVGSVGQKRLEGLHLVIVTYITKFLLILLFNRN